MYRLALLGLVIVAVAGILAAAALILARALTTLILLAIVVVALWSVLTHLAKRARAGH